MEENAKPFYERYGFTKFYEYHHVRINGREKLRAFDRNGLHIVSLYAHVMPETDLEDIIEKYKPKEVFTCSGFEINVTTRPINKKRSKTESDHTRAQEKRSHNNR